MLTFCFFLNLFQSIPNHLRFFVHIPGVADVDIEQIDPKKTDPEYLEFQCLNVEEVEKLLNETVEHLSNTIHLTPSLAKVLLLEHEWQATEIVEKYNRNPSGLLVSVYHFNAEFISYVTTSNEVHFSLLLFLCHPPYLSFTSSR